MILPSKRLSLAELDKWFKSRSDISVVAINKIVYFAERENIFQILYSYGEESTLILLEYFINREMYEDCQMVYKQILEHNKLTGDNISTTLEEFESLRRKNRIKTDI